MSESERSPRKDPTPTDRPIELPASPYAEFPLLEEIPFTYLARESLGLRILHAVRGRPVHERTWLSHFVKQARESRPQEWGLLPAYTLIRILRLLWLMFDRGRKYVRPEWLGVHDQTSRHVLRNVTHVYSREAARDLGAHVITRLPAPPSRDGLEIVYDPLECPVWPAPDPLTDPANAKRRKGGAA